MKLVELHSTLLLNILSMEDNMILKCKWLCTTPVKLLVSIVTKKEKKILTDIPTF